MLRTKEGRQCFAYERSSATDHRPSNTLTYTNACKSKKKGINLSNDLWLLSCVLSPLGS